MYSNKEFWIREHEDYQCKMGIAQFMNSTTPGRTRRTAVSELVPIMMDSNK